MAAKILMPGGPTILSLSQKSGISQSSLWRWVQGYKKKGATTMTTKSRRPMDWTKEERFEAIVTTKALKGTELGVYLRKHGLTTSHLEKWHNEFIHSSDQPKVGRKPNNSTEKELIKENKSLKRDLQRKDKALAEASALLILKKKAQMIWGNPEEEE